MYRIQTNKEDILNELEDIVRLFVPEYKRGGSDDNNDIVLIEHFFIQSEDFSINSNKILIGGELAAEDKFAYGADENALQIKRKLLKSAKTAVFKALHGRHGVELPYGSLTGVRPTKLAWMLVNGGIDENSLADFLQNEYFVSTEKAALITRILKNQKEYIDVAANEIDLYINIPFCPSRCVYCSFISMDYKKSEALIPDYLETLKYEISAVMDMVSDLKYRIRSIYIGGGTPTVLSAGQLENIFKLLPKVREFTLEAGRPETVTEDKLKIMLDYNVSRISINPQTFNDNVLNVIGRGHTSQDILNAYGLARKCGNFSINMDIIAGLPADNYQSFTQTVDKVAGLTPDNITVHTLSKKRSSNYSGGDFGNADGVSAMIAYSAQKLGTSGYVPYYMYRQKYMSGNLENTGYTLPGKQCIFNIGTMEENISVVACGANAITKIYYPGTNRIERAANVKNITEYIDRIDEMLIRKKKLLYNGLPL